MICDYERRAEKPRAASCKPQAAKKITTALSLNFVEMLCMLVV